jgi:hypothetical protein
MEIPLEITEIMSALPWTANTVLPLSLRCRVAGPLVAKFASTLPLSASMARTIGAAWSDTNSRQADFSSASAGGIMQPSASAAQESVSRRRGMVFLS